MKDGNFHPEIYNDPAQLTEKSVCTPRKSYWLNMPYLPQLILVGNFTSNHTDIQWSILSKKDYLLDTDVIYLTLPRRQCVPRYYFWQCSTDTARGTERPYPHWFFLATVQQWRMVTGHLPPGLLPPRFLPPRHLPPRLLPPRLLPPRHLPPGHLPPRLLPPRHLPSRLDISHPDFSLLDISHQTSPTRTSPTLTSPTQTSPTRTSPTRTSPTRTSPTRTSPTQTSPTHIFLLWKCWKCTVDKRSSICLNFSTLILDKYTTVGQCFSL